jgi:hypothetical protein
MSYPEPRYFGDTGEVSATYRSVDQPPARQHLALTAYPSGSRTSTTGNPSMPAKSEGLQV